MDSAGNKAPTALGALLSLLDLEQHEPQQPEPDDGNQADQQSHLVGLTVLDMNVRRTLQHEEINRDQADEGPPPNGPAMIHRIEVMVGDPLENLRARGAFFVVERGRAHQQ